MPDGNVITEGNVLAPRAWSNHPFLANSDNLDGQHWFDDAMKLTGAGRDLYLGRRGAEIAVAAAALFADGFEGSGPAAARARQR